MIVATPQFHARVWGSRDLRAWYPDRAPEPEPIGESWLTPTGCPVLVKMLFPTERLSVQVHPDDTYAAAHGLGVGKSEAWYVTEARAGAQVAVGLGDGVSWEAFADACRQGRASELLRWVAVAPGDTVNVPAGTIHAIGSGLVLCEVQQPSDNTFRLDDYGRGRTLHLEHGLAAACANRAGSAAGVVRPGLASGLSGKLVTTPYFKVWRHCLAAGATLPPATVPRWIVNLGSPGPIPRGHLASLAPGETLAVAAATTWLEIQEVR
ncbi:MAG: class I mannose-6-phosphate isomerase [Terriglobales bacterium]